MTGIAYPPNQALTHGVPYWQGSASEPATTRFHQKIPFVLEIGKKQVKRMFILLTMFQDDKQGVDVVTAGGFRAEISQYSRRVSFGILTTIGRCGISRTFA